MGVRVTDLSVGAPPAAEAPPYVLQVLREACLFPQVRSIRQRRRKFNEEKRQAIKDEKQKLLAAGHIREIQYPEWLANVVLVKKSSGKWRICVDFTDLNKACPKDSYPLPSIDALVDSASGCKLLSFLDAFSGYN